MSLPTLTLEQQEEGKFTLTFVLTKAQLDNLDAEVDGEDSVAGRKDYCCTCIPKGNRHTIQASNSLSAAYKCFKKCGSFQLSKGKC